MTKKQEILGVAGFITLLAILIGATYAFFNYTRTGANNTLGTGRIYFNTVEGTTLNITNAFPMTSNEAINANLDSLTIGVVGDTNYIDGEEFKISITDVSNTINGKQIPINYIATYVAANGGTTGSFSDDYYNARNAKNASIYTVNGTGPVEEDSEILVGYIDNGATGISGTLTIKAYIDADRIAITDTYNGPSSTPNDNNGTTSSWVNGRTVFTTTEWNSLSSNPVSFKIKVESNEGIWVPGKIASCPGCMYLDRQGEIFLTWNTMNQTPTVITTGLSNNYLDIVNSSGNNYFMGVILNSSNQVTKAYVCGIKGDIPFCLEGTNDGSSYTTNQTLLQSASLWNNTCTVTGSSSTTTKCSTSNPDLYVSTSNNGDAYVLGEGEAGYFIDSNGGRMYSGALD